MEFMELLINAALTVVSLEVGTTAASFAIRKYVQWKLIKSLADKGYKLGDGSLDYKSKADLKYAIPVYVLGLNLICDFGLL